MYYKKFALLFLVLINSMAIFGEQKSLNGVWLFEPDYYNVGKEQGWYKSDSKKLFTNSMAVPGTWNTTLPYAEYIGKAWYKTTFLAPQNWENKILLLNFEGVYNDCEIWLNGMKIGSHDLGFLLFQLDVTKSVKLGEQNTLILMVDNTFKLGATWNWGGIRRPVWIDVQPANFVSSVKVNSNIDLRKKSADLTFKVAVQATKPEQRHELKVSIYNSSGDLLIEKKQPLTLQSGTADYTISSNIKKVDLWHFNEPRLYTCKVELLHNKNVVSSKTERFGLRKVEVVGEELRLNGESVRLVGANWVPDDRFTGNTLPFSRIKEDVDLMKSAGINMARLSHLPLTKEALDYLDEKGIMIFEEIPLWNKNVHVTTSNEVPARWLTSSIKERYNHPCIIGWTVGNEIGRLTDNPDIRGYVESAIKLVKSLDPDRIAAYVTHTAAKQGGKEPVDLCDMILFNQYGAHGERADTVHKYYPGKPLFYAEYGRKPNVENPNLGIVDFDAMLNSMRGRDYLIGGSVWTFNDYRSNYVSGTNPSENRCWGVVNVYRQKKRAYKAMQKEYLPVKDFAVKINNVASGFKGSVTLVPRTKLDIPAYAMQGYLVAYSIFNDQNKFTIVQKNALPKIEVASLPVVQNFELSQKSEVLKVELLDPQGYSVYDTILYYVKPAKPKVEQVFTSASKVRIFFTKSALGQEYYAVYAEGKTTAKTINNFVEIEGFEYGQTCTVSIVAVNSFGESEPSHPVTFTANEQELPLVIWHSAIQNNMLCIGFESEVDDFMYDVEYGLSPDKLTRVVNTRQRGALMLPLVEKDKAHYFRMRKRIRYGYASAWSQVVEVK